MKEDIKPYIAQFSSLTLKSRQIERVANLRRAVVMGKLMKEIVAILIVLFLVGCIAQTRPIEGPSSAMIGTLSLSTTKIPKACLYAFDDHIRKLIKVSGEQPPIDRDPCAWTPPIGVGKKEALPEKVSERHQKEIDASKRLYEEGNYRESARVAQSAVEDEPENAYILECCARALYRIDRSASYEIYRRLISLLDRKNAPNEIVVDVWFMEAYWKFGTLLMDRNEWEKAAFEISRALAATYTLNEGQPFVLQAYSYLTEAYFEMGRHDIAKYYANAALEINPDNKYVKYYLDLMRND